MHWLRFLEDYKESEKVAIIDQGKNTRYSYKDMYEQTCRWIEYLKTKNFQKGDRVAYYSENSKEHLLILFACAKLELIFVPLNFRLTLNETREIINQIKPALLIASHVCEISGDFERVELSQIKLNKYEPHAFKSLDPKIATLMLFTSGSSGVPKGVLLHGEMLYSNQKETVRSWELKPSDRSMVETPFFHTGAYNVLCLPLLSIGASVVITKGFSADNFYQTLNHEQISVYFGVPTMFKTIAEDKSFENTDFSTLRFLISGGAACPIDLITKFQKKNLMFKQGFGLTEVGPNCFLLSEKYAKSKLGSIGVPMPHTSAMLIDENNNEVKDGEVGELVLAGPHVCLSFFNREEDFRGSFFEGHYRTGDLALKDEDGFYYIKGRKKEMYISGGENVYPAEVEERICEHEDIMDAQVVSVAHKKWGEVGYAFVRSQKHIELAQLRDYLNSHLSRYKHPFHVENMNEFPLLANGKIDKKQLQEIAARRVANV